MGTGRGLCALFGLLAGMGGCAADPSEDPTSGDALPLDVVPASSEKGGDTVDSAPAPSLAPEVHAVPESIPTTLTRGETVLERARTWVAAKMPYCGVVNGSTDPICGGTCTRTPVATSPEWDPYRSDCSGFVSWAWGLPAPGRRTATLAPFVTDVSGVINVSDLALGDALNTNGHVMLWAGWVDEAAGKARILQETNCGGTAVEGTLRLTKVDATTLKSSDGRVFHAIRHKPQP